MEFSDIVPRAKRRSLPVLPYLRAIADRRLPAVSDYRGLKKLRVLKQLFFLVLVVREIFNKLLLIGLAFLVEQFVHAADGFFDRGIFAAAHAVFCDVDELIFYSALLEPALGFFRIEAFGFSEYLYVHI